MRFSYRSLDDLGEVSVILGVCLGIGFGIGKLFRFNLPGIVKFAIVALLVVIGVQFMDEIRLSWGRVTPFLFFIWIGSLMAGPKRVRKVESAKPAAKREADPPPPPQPQVVEKPRHDRLHPDDLALLAAAQQKHWAPKQNNWSSIVTIGVIATIALLAMGWTATDSNSQRRQLEAEEARLRQRVAEQQVRLASLPQGEAVSLQVSPQTSGRSKKPTTRSSSAPVNVGPKPSVPASFTGQESDVFIRNLDDALKGVPVNRLVTFVGAISYGKEQSEASARSLLQVAVAERIASTIGIESSELDLDYDKIASSIPIVVETTGTEDKTEVRLKTQIRTDQLNRLVESQSYLKGQDRSTQVAKVFAGSLFVLAGASVLLRLGSGIRQIKR